MDYGEKKVIQRREGVIAHCVDFNDDLQNRIMRQGLLTKQQVRKIWKGKDNQQKAKELCQFLIISPSQTSFSQLCFLLENLDLSFVEEFLRADLLMVRGELPVDEYFLATASVRARKIPELKDEHDALIQAVALTISEECQVVKEACSKQMETVQVERDRKEECENELINLINERLMDLRRDMADLRPISGVSKSVSQVSDYGGRKKKGGKSKEMTSQELIEETIRALQDDVEKIRDSMSDLLEERRNCFELMREDDDGGKLDEHLRRYIDAMQAEIKKSRFSQVRNSKGGRSRLDDLEIQTQEQEEAIRNLQTSLLDIQHELEIAIAEKEYWKCRCEKLEKCRRIGYHSKEVNEGGKKGKVTISKAEFLKNPDDHDPELKQMREKIESARSAGRPSGGSGDVISCSHTCRLHCVPCKGRCEKHCH